MRCHIMLWSVVRHVMSAMSFHTSFWIWSSRLRFYYYYFILFIYFQGKKGKINFAEKYYSCHDGIIRSKVWVDRTKSDFEESRNT